MESAAQGRHRLLLLDQLRPAPILTPTPQWMLTSAKWGWCNMEPCALAFSQAHKMRDPGDPASCQEDSSDEDDDEDF